jgi:hypothetical protein
MSVIFFNLLLCVLPAPNQTLNCAATDFQYQVRQVQGATLRSIALIRRGDAAAYSLKLFKISGKIELVQSETQVSADEFELKPVAAGDYLIMVNWGAGCSQTLGGVEGIQITPN